MFRFVALCLGMLVRFFRERRTLLLENLALRQQLVAHHVFADTALTDVDAEFEEFAMDAGCTPRGILPAHFADHRSDLGRNDGSSGLAAAHLPGPEQAKPGTMPGNDRFWLDDGERR